MKQMFDFVSSNELPYEKRSQFGAGDYYGIGEGAKHGKLKSSFMSIKAPSKKSMKPPIKVA
jgi:hypothetical protein